MSKAFTAGMLPDSEKESLCYALLHQMGVTNIRANPRTGELVHGCLVSAYHSDQDRNPTASLNYQKLTFNCLGCGAHGGILWFIATVQKCTTTQAYKWLEETGGINPDSMESEKLLSIIQAYYSPRANAPDIIPAYSIRVLLPWIEYVHPYMTTGAEDLGIRGRNIPVSTLREMRVGWDPDEDRIIIPHFWKGSLVGWQGRRIWDWQGEKYRSTPDFPKDQTLYNFDPTKRYKNLLVVESPMSVLAKKHLMERLPDTEMTATFGGKVTDRQVSLITRAEHVIYWMDNDEGGWSAMTDRKDLPGLPTRTSPHARVSVVDSPWDADPADVSDKEFVSLVSRAIPHVLWRPRTGALRDYDKGVSSMTLKKHGVGTVIGTDVKDEDEKEES